MSDREMIADVLDDAATLIGIEQSSDVLLRDRQRVLAGIGLTDAADVLRVNSLAASSNVFRVVVAGEIQTGKSSLINALLGANVVRVDFPRGTTNPLAIVHPTWQGDPAILPGLPTAPCEHELLADNVALIDMPGLKGDYDTAILRAFWYADAVILVLSSRSLSVKVIDAVYGRGRLPHVFFVVNKMDELSDEERQKLDLRRRFSPFFLDSDGIIDEKLYANRVFFTSAKNALTNNGDPFDIASLYAALHRLVRIEREESRLGSARSILRRVTTEAFKVINRRKGLLDQLSEVPEIPTDDSTSHLVANLKWAEQIFCEELAGAFTNALWQFFEQLAYEWDQDTHKLQIDNGNVFDQIFEGFNKLQDLRLPGGRSSAKDEEKRRLIAKLEDSIVEYMQQKFGEFAGSLKEHQAIHDVLVTYERAVTSCLSSLSRRLGKPIVLPTQLMSEDLPQSDIFSVVFASFDDEKLMDDSLLAKVRQQTTPLDAIKKVVFTAIQREFKRKENKLRAYIHEAVQPVIAAVMKTVNTALTEHQESLRLEHKQRTDDAFSSNEERMRLEAHERLLLGRLVQLGAISKGDAPETLLEAHAPLSSNNYYGLWWDGVQANPLPAGPLPLEPARGTTDQLAPLDVQLLEPLEQAVAAAAEGLRPRKLTELERLLRTLDNLVGLETVKQRIRKLYYFQQELKQRRQMGLPDSHPTLHMVFMGNPGTGKTTVAQSIAKLYYSLGLIQRPHVEEANYEKLVAMYVGHTAKKTTKVIDDSLGGILFVDEAYTLADPSRGGFGGEALDTLLIAMEDKRDQLTVIVAGYPKRMQEFLDANPGLSRRFPLSNRIQFEDFTEAELQIILENELSDRGYSLSEDAQQAIRKVIHNIYETRDPETFGNAGEMRNFADSLALNHAVRIQESKQTKRPLLSSSPITAGDIDERYQQFVRMPSSNLESVLQELETLVGLQPVKSQIRKLAAQLRLETESGRVSEVPPTLHMIFQGNPGTGKTTIARLMGKLLKALGMLRKGQMVEVTRADLVGAYQGETARKTRLKIQQALDGVLFIDEAYSLFMGERDQYGLEALTELLAAMENERERLVVIITGYPMELENFLGANSGLRSRFPITINFPDYKLEELIEIFKLEAKKRSFEISPHAETLLELYLQSHMGIMSSNARMVRNLLDDMVGRHAERIFQIAQREEREREMRVFNGEDVPPIPVDIVLTIKEGKASVTVSKDGAERKVRYRPIPAESQRMR